MGGKGSSGAWGYKGLESDWVGSNPGSATSSWATLGTLTCQNSIFPVENESNAYLIGCLGGLNGKMYPEHLILCLAYRQGLPNTYIIAAVMIFRWEMDTIGEFL